MIKRLIKTTAMVMITVAVVSGCSVKPIGFGEGGESIFDRTIDKVANEKAYEEALKTITPMKVVYSDNRLEIIGSLESEIIKDGEEIEEGLLYQFFMELETGEVPRLIKGEKTYTIDDLFVDLDPSRERFQYTEYKQIKGYFEGTYHFEQLSPTLSTLVFIDKTSNKHLDLAEIEHKENQWITDVFMKDDFSEIRYVLGSEDGIESGSITIDDGVMTTEGTPSIKIVWLGVDTLTELPNTILWDSNTQEIRNEDLRDHVGEIIEVEEKNKAIIDKSIYDKVIANGVVVDPETRTYKFGYDVGIIDDKIAKISDGDLTGNEVLDATGLMVSPGFIDMLSINPTDTIAKYKITDGVTTNLSMHGCTDDFAGFFAGYDKYKTFVNYGGAVYAVRLRMDRGLGFYGTPTEEDIAAMAMRTREEIEAGAIALAFSPEYYTGTTGEEIKGMMAVAAEYDIPTHFHTRYSAVEGEFTGIDGVKEVLGYAKETGGKIHIMHLHSTGGTGAMEEALELIDQARKEGVEVTYDIYPYDSWGMNITSSRFDDGWQKALGITYSDLQMAGTSEPLSRASFEKYREDGGLVIAHAMSEEEIILAMDQPGVMIGSDSGIVDETVAGNHHKGSGSFAKILGEYVRDKDLFSLMDGLSKMTINSADFLAPVSESMAMRGRMKEGCIADITLFDYRTVDAMSTIEAPATQSKGIPYVFVSGHLAVVEGELDMTVRQGKPITSNYLED